MFEKFVRENNFEFAMLFVKILINKAIDLKKERKSQRKVKLREFIQNMNNMMESNSNEA